MIKGYQAALAKLITLNIWFDSIPEPNRFILFIVATLYMHGVSIYFGGGFLYMFCACIFIAGRLLYFIAK